MDEDTTTASVDTSTGVEASAQPEEDIFGDAAAQSPEPTTTNETTTEPEATQAQPVADENLEWLQNKGVDPTDPEAVAKLAKMAREAERAMHEAKQPKLNEALADPQQIEQPADTQEQVVSDPRIDAIILERNVEKFFGAGGDADLAAERKALEPSMAQIVSDNPAIGQMVKSGYMTYEQLFALAKGSDPQYGQKLKQDGGREALEQVANKQQARAVQGIATSSAVSGDTQADPFLAAFDSVK